MKKYYCKEPNCNNEICYKNWKEGQGRCRSCAMKQLSKNPEKHTSYKDGRSLRKYYCIDCLKNGIKTEIVWRAKRCRSCATKKQCQNPQNSPNWQGGISFEEYPPGWTRTLKESIRIRDNYTCQLCSCPEVECNRKLSIHHIDYNKDNLNPENLISLCQSCHRKTNGSRKYWVNYFKEKRDKNVY